MASILDDKNIVRILRDNFRISIDDAYDKDGKNVNIVVLDEMPFSPHSVTDVLLLKVPSLIGTLGLLHENCKAKVASLYQQRKTERARLANSCLNPVSGASPITKTTEKAVEAYVECQPAIISLNAEYEQAKAEMGIVGAAFTAMQEYNTNLRAYFKCFSNNEMVSGPPKMCADPKDEIRRIKREIGGIARCK